MFVKQSFESKFGFESPVFIGVVGKKKKQYPSILPILIGIVILIAIGVAIAVSFGSSTSSSNNESNTAGTVSTTTIKKFEGNETLSTNNLINSTVEHEVTVLELTSEVEFDSVDECLNQKNELAKQLALAISEDAEGTTNSTCGQTKRETYVMAFSIRIYNIKRKLELYNAVMSSLNDLVMYIQNVVESSTVKLLTQINSNSIKVVIIVVENETKSSSITSNIHLTTETPQIISSQIYESSKSSQNVEPTLSVSDASGTEISSRSTISIISTSKGTEIPLHTSKNEISTTKEPSFFSNFSGMERTTSHILSSRKTKMAETINNISEDSTLSKLLTLFSSTKTNSQSDDFLTQTQFSTAALSNSDTNESPNGETSFHTKQRSTNTKTTDTTGKSSLRTKTSTFKKTQSTTITTKLTSTTTQSTSTITQSASTITQSTTTITQSTTTTTQSTSTTIQFTSATTKYTGTTAQYTGITTQYTGITTQYTRTTTQSSSTTKTDSLLFPSTCGVSGSITRIVNGDIVEPNSIPFIVRLAVQRADGWYLCGGSIINNRWIVTAAHCVEGAISSYIYVGDHTRFKWDLPTEVMMEIENIEMHSDYIGSSSKIAYDIALMRTKNEITFGVGVQPICLSELEKNIGDEVTVAGWGRVSTSGSTSTELRKVNIDIKADSFCGVSDDDEQDTVFCAGDIDNARDTCFGDSGGPLYYVKDGRFTVVGVISYTISGCIGKGGYTKLPFFKNWMTTIMKSYL